MKKLITRFTGREEGFTLIELLIVIVIIAILIAIAIPAFLGARGRAQDRAAQALLRNSATTQETIYTEDQSYTLDDGDLEAEEPGIDFVAAGVDALAKDNQVAVEDGDADSYCLQSKSAKDDGWWRAIKPAGGRLTVEVGACP